MEIGEDHATETSAPAEADTTEATETPISILTDAVDDFQCSKCSCRIDVSGLEAFTQVECPDCGAVEGVPAQLGNFLLLKLLGTGGMGGVYIARDETLGRFVAIKVMLQSLGDDAAFIETFRREAQAVAKLNHPNISQIYSFGQEKGQPYIVMELVNGERVDEMMETEAGIAPALAVRICYEVAQGLSAADEAGIVHGDIKPENILLDIKGRAKIVDFGLATVAHAAAAEGIWGTPYYIAPEKIRRQKVDARADIYSLGATLYHILAGKPPFEGETPVAVVKARLEQPPPDLKEACPDLPDKVVSVVSRMLAVERTERYPTYKSLISDMRKALLALGDTPVKTARRGGKQIRIKKKRTSTPTPAQSGSEEVGHVPASPPGRKRLVIRKGNNKHSISIKKTGTGDRATLTPTPPTPEELERKRQAQLKRQRAAITTIAIILAVVLSIGIGGFVVYRKQATIKARAEYFACLNAKESCLELYTQIMGTASNSALLVAKSSGYDDTIKNTVLAITGVALVVNFEVQAPIEKEETSEASATSTTNTEASATNTVTDSSPPEDAESSPDAESADIESEVRPDVDTDAVDIESEVQPDLDTDAVEPVVDPVVDDTPGADAPPVTKMGYSAIVNLKKLRAMNARMQTLAANAEAANTTAQKAAISTTAIPKAKELKGFAEKSEIYQDSISALAKAAKAGYDTVIDLKNAYDAEVEATRLAEIEAQRQAEEAARLEQERTEREALEVQEQERAKQDYNSIKLLFAENDFDGIVSQLEQSLAGYQTEVGRAALQITIDRFKGMTAMRDVLIESINGEPFPWGWGRGSAQRDISAASKDGISIRDTDTVHAWKDVGVGQMLKLVDNYLGSRNVRATDKAKLSFGAALYCNEFGDKAKTKTKTYLNQALNLGFPRDVQERVLNKGW
jgi:serine/threonine protein kinase